MLQIGIILIVPILHVLGRNVDLYSVVGRAAHTPRTHLGRHLFGGANLILLLASASVDIHGVVPLRGSLVQFQSRLVAAGSGNLIIFVQGLGGFLSHGINVLFLWRIRGLLGLSTSGH